MKAKDLLPAVVMTVAFTAYYETAHAQEIGITGSVESKCVIIPETQGVYGNPTADKLTTDPSSGGVIPTIRFDVVLADAYKAAITYPTSFSTSPTLSDSVQWTGDTSVTTVSDAAMADYETNKVEYNATTEFDLHTAGSTWFGVESIAEYGQGKSFPAGTYRAVVLAECIAK